MKEVSKAVLFNRRAHIYYEIIRKTVSTEIVSQIWDMHMIRPVELQIEELKNE